VIACLLSKLKALSSILITTKTLTTIDNIYWALPVFTAV
jgi:hypothetical protein